jgi:hypothetical protein
MSGRVNLIRHRLVAVPPSPSGEGYNKVGVVSLIRHRLGKPRRCHRLIGGKGNRRFWHRKHGTYVFAHLNLHNSTLCCCKKRKFRPLERGKATMWSECLLTQKISSRTTFGTSCQTVFGLRAKRSLGEMTRLVSWLPLEGKLPKGDEV